jgi:CheY-like chemotaxis protein
MFGGAGVGVALVLVVDDEMTDSAITRGIVEAMGHEVCLASDGQEAFRLFMRKDIDLVVTDLQMPRVDGLELIDGILALYPDTKIIAVSAGGEDRLLAARAMGAIAGVSKPVDPERLGKAFALAGFDQG